MAATQLLAGVAALLVAAGVAVIVGGSRRTALDDRRVQLGGLARGRIRGLIIAVAAAGAAWLLTGWPVAAMAAGAAALGLPAIVGADARAESRIARVEAVEEWSRRVADVLAIGVGLEQAIQTSARTAPGPIAAEVSTLAARIAARMPTEEALRLFADEVGDPTADLVAAALVLACRRRGPGVATALTALAESVSEEVAARRRIEADRAKPRATARAVTVITMLIAGVGLMNRGYTGPYGTPLGQVVLAGTLGFFGASLWWMHSMTRTEAAPRLLSPAGPEWNQPGPDGGRS